MTDSREKKAFEILAAENAGMLTTYLKCLVNDQAAVDDLFQETMVVAWRRLDECDLSRPFGPWLRGIASKLVMAYFRKKKRVPIAMNEAVLARLDENFESVRTRTGDTWGDKLDGLEECIKALPREYYDVIQLRYRQDESVKAISDSLRISLETCKKRLQRARLRIADCLRSKGFSMSEA